MFEWDEEKRQRNLAEHKVDFADAAVIFDSPFIEMEDLRNDYGEMRYRALGKVDGDYFMAVYTWRDKKRRIISAWKVGKNGRKKYSALFHE